MKKHTIVAKIVLNIVLILGMLLGPVGNLASTVQAAPAPAPAPAPAAAPAPAQGTDAITDPKASALVLVNSASSKYSDFAHYIQPYLDHFGVPYTTLDINSSDLPADLGLYALIIIGHAQIDTGGTANLSPTEQTAIVNAVNAGTGLVNFDNDLSADHSAGRYAFINSIFNFSYNSTTSGSDVNMPTAQSHWITNLHPDGDMVETKTAMTLAGISLPATMTALATTGAQPFLAVTNSGAKAVQFGSYDWMSNTVRGPLFGLDDLVWRSLVWAARKPFVMQGMPPFVTLRMDDVSNPMIWVPQANSVGFKPWLGLFTDDITGSEIADVKTLVDTGKATAAIHAFNTSRFFYFNHNAGVSFTDEEMTANMTEASNWFTTNGIAKSKYVVPHYYEIGANAFAGLTSWGAEYTATMMNPGQLEATANWMQVGPFRKYESGPAGADVNNLYNVAYADYVPFADTSPYYKKFFNCVTEIRDADLSTHYEWDPRPYSMLDPEAVTQSIAYGTEWITRALDSMTLATLFSHEYLVNDVDGATFQTMMDSIAANLQGYNPEYVTIDDACKYVRAITNSQIDSATYNTSTNVLTTSLSGTTDTQTRFYVFGEQGGSIVHWLVNVNAFTGTIPVNFTIPGVLDHVTISPLSPTVKMGSTQQFTAVGYDASNNVIPGLTFNWNVANGGGTIDANGLFTAGTTAGTFNNTVVATSGSMTGTASVTVIATTLDHFAFDTVASPKLTNYPFTVTVRALDSTGAAVITYNGTANLSASTGTVSPTTTGAFTNGVWTGQVTLNGAEGSTTLTANDGASHTGTSNAFTVNHIRDCPCTIFDTMGTPTDLNANDGSAQITVGMRFYSDVSGYISGVRFYKSSLSTGTHIGRLYSNSGTKLAEATFTNETTSGWQEVRFTNPVAITAGTTYVVAVYSSTGYYSFSLGVFNTQVDAAPLHAPATTVEANGLYAYSNTFPTSTSGGASYWVDPIFDTVSTQRQTLWYGSSTPSNPNAQETTAIETGIKFRSTVTGKVTGLRFYRGSANTGTHTASLWSANGTPLASTTFTGESAQGWQQVMLSTPVDIAANTTYVVSVHSSGTFAYTPAFFNSGVNGLYLRALQTGEDGPNGVYKFTATPAFPTEDSLGSNYWTDVVFEPGALQDTTAPSVTSVSPVNNASGVTISANITAAFNEALDPNTVNTTNFTLVDAQNNPVSTSVSYNAITHVVTINPINALTYSTVYTARLLGGTTGISDAAGNRLAANYTWTFTTGASSAIDPNQGPGGPILVISTSTDPFSKYYAEILRTEGLNNFYVLDLASVDATVLNNYDVVILGQMTLTPAQVTMLTNWVTAGGNLIAMRPDKQLTTLLGLTDLTSTMSDAYMGTLAGSLGNYSFLTDRLQYHSAADLYNAAAGTTVVAGLYADLDTETSFAGVTLRSVGSNGGQAAAFTYDLARSIVYTRQGNPAWAGQERDGNLPKRSNDMFYGAKEGDVQPDWINLDRVYIPQADEQQRLLVNMILYMNANRKPLPRFWYFPGDEKAVVIMTGDDHTGIGTMGRFDVYSAASTEGCSVDNWECIRSTSYIDVNNPMTEEQAATYESDGFEVAVHLETGCSDYTPAEMASAYSSQLTTFLTRYDLIDSPVSLRAHCIVWPDWASQPKIELTHGIRLDTNYYYWPGTWLLNRPGFFTGSGMVMRFADLDGSMIDVYQAATQMTDESGIVYDTHINTLLDNATNANGYYAAVTANMHTDDVSSAGSDAILASAKSHGVPVISARQMLTWLDGRNGSSFQNLAWNSNTLTFNIAVGAGANRLRAMLPLQVGVVNLNTITRGGGPVTYKVEQIKGVNYAIFDALTGSYSVSYIQDTDAPVISAVVASPKITEAQVTYTTSEAANGRVDYGTSASNLNLASSTADYSTAHAFQLGSLTAGTTYYYRVTSVDAYSNSTTYPAVGDAPLSFTTSTDVFADETDASFAQGTLDGCYIGNGVRLLPAMGQEFTTTTQPAGWFFTSAGGAVTFTGSAASIQQGLLGTDAVYNTGRSLEFTTKFTLTDGNVQHVGLGEDFNVAIYAIFSTGNTVGSQLLVRTNSGSGESTDTLTTVDPSVAHKFRIDWLSDKVQYYVDGALVATHNVVIGSAMRPLAGDYGPGSPLVLDYMRLSPYGLTCSYQSRIFAAQGIAKWDRISFAPDAAALPAGTSYTVSYRTGATPIPDSNWTTFTAVTNGSQLSGETRYIQYKLDLTTPSALVTPWVDNVRIYYTAGADTTPPTVTGRAPAAGATGIALNTNVTATFSEVMNAGTISTSTFHLRAQDATTDVPATVSYSNATLTATLVPSAALANGTTYTVTLDSTMADTSGNLLGANVTWTFTTLYEQITDTTEANFSAGTPGTCSVVTNVNDGEVILAPAINTEFTGLTYPTGWAVAEDWGNDGGGATLTGTTVSVDSVNFANKNTEYTSGHSLEFVATFTSQNSQHVGFVEGIGGTDDYNGIFAIFSTNGGNAQEGIYVRTGATSDFIAGDYLDTANRYRIDWYANKIVYSINGQVVKQHDIAVIAGMHLSISDYFSTQPLVVDWLRMSPYALTCDFTSRVIDAGKQAEWLGLTYTGSTPAGTALNFKTRSGDTTNPGDGTWSTWAAIGAQGAISSPSSRYIQYQATLTTTGPDPMFTPALEAVYIELRGANTSVTWTKNLVTGWNLVSIPLVLPDTAPATALASLSGNFDLVYAWDAATQTWKSYAPGFFANTLTAIDNTNGYWIHMTASDTLSVTGTKPTSTTIPMKVGWNLVGFPAEAAKALPAALNTYGVTSYTSVYQYNAADTSDPWKTYDPAAPPITNDLAQMAPGWGYWVKVTAESVWTVPYVAP